LDGERGFTVGRLIEGRGDDIKITCYSRTIGHVSINLFILPCVKTTKSLAHLTALPAIAQPYILFLQPEYSESTGETTHSSIMSTIVQMRN